MPALPKDSELCKLAKAVGEYAGFSPATPEQQSRCNNRNSFPWVYRKGNAWIVKPGWNGAVFRIGVFSEPVTATRFAAMAIRRFWKYRKYCTTPISDRNLTHSIAASIADEAANPSASIYLDSIEQRLTALGAFKNNNNEHST